MKTSVAELGCDYDLSHLIDQAHSSLGMNCT